MCSGLLADEHQQVVLILIHIISNCFLNAVKLFNSVKFWVMKCSFHDEYKLLKNFT